MPSPAPSLLAAAIILLATAGEARAADYYVDGSNPACSNGGPGSEAVPYCTIGAAVAARAGPGNRILVRPGTYREQVTFPTSGAAGNPFTLEALGGPVVVDGSDDFASPALWADTGEDVFLAATVAWNPLQVFMDGARLKPSSEDPGSLPESSFTWVSGEGLYVNAGGGNPGDRALLVGRRLHGFLASAKSWIAIRGFTVARTESRGIYLNNGCADVVLSRDTVSLANSYGIQAVNGLRVLIEECRSSFNHLHGFGLTAGSTACTLRANHAFGNADPNIRRANGIHLFGAPGNTLDGNRLHDNQDSGVHFGDGSNDCLAVNNRSWNNGDHGFDHISAIGTVHIHDVAYGNFRDGFSIEDPSPNCRLYNCIGVDNGLTTNHYNLWVNAPSSVGFVSDYNIFWNSTSQPPIRFISTSYPTLAGYQAASGQDAHSFQADPRFLDGPAGDFHLMPGSPAIDAGTSDVPGWPALDAGRMARVDDPAMPNVGAGPVPYPDRGSFEYQAATAGVGDDPTSGPEARARVAPNPARGPARLGFELGRRGPVRVDLFDLTGRIVRTLLDEADVGAGRHELAFDLTAGGGAPPGLYFFRIRTAEGARRGRFMLLR